MKHIKVLLSFLVIASLLIPSSHASVQPSHSIVTTKKQAKKYRIQLQITCQDVFSSLCTEWKFTSATAEEAELNSPDKCFSYRKYRKIDPGSTVKVTNAKNKIVAVGTLSKFRVDLSYVDLTNLGLVGFWKTDCGLKTVIKKIPKSSFYTITIDSSTVVGTFSKQEFIGRSLDVNAVYIDLYNN